MADTMKVPDPTRPSATTRPGDDGAREARPGVEGAGGVVFDPHGRVLLIRHESGAWVFPKGHLDEGEDHLQAAVREVEEEAGVQARCEDPAAHWTTAYVNDRGRRRRITWYRMECDVGEPVMREHLFPEGEFLPPEEAMERLSHDEDRRLLSRILEG